MMPGRFSVAEAASVGTPIPTGGSFMQGVGQGFAAQAPGMSQALEQKRQYTSLSDLEKLEKAVPASEQMLINDFKKNMDKMTDTQRQEAVVSLQKKLGDDGDKLLLYWVKRADEPVAPSIKSEAGKYYPQVIQAMMGTTPEKEYQLRMGELPKDKRGEALTERLAPWEEMQPGLTEKMKQFIPTGEKGVLDPVTAARQRVEEATTEGRRTGDLQAALEKMDRKVKLPWEQQAVIDALVETEVLHQVGADAAVTYINHKIAPDWAHELPESMHKNVFGIDRDDEGNLINAIEEVVDAASMKKAITQINARAVFRADMPIEQIEKKFTPEQRTMIYAAAFGKQKLGQGDLEAVNTEGMPSRFSADMLEVMENPVSEFDLTGVTDPEGKRQAVFLKYVYKLVIALQSIEAAAAALTLGMDMRLIKASKTFSE